MGVSTSPPRSGLLWPPTVHPSCSNVSSGCPRSGCSMSRRIRCGSRSRPRLHAAVVSGVRVPASLKDRDRVELTDLPCFGRQAILVWLKRRWRCLERSCPVGSWTETDPQIGSPRLRLTDRAGRWATYQVGAHGRTVTEVAKDLGCAWHTVNDAVIAYGTRLVDDPARIGHVTALGLDETKFVRRGRFKIKSWSTSIVDVSAGRLLDVVEGRAAAPVAAWLRNPTRRGGSRSGSRRWTCPARTARCSTTSCRMRSRSLIRFIWSAWRTEARRGPPPGPAGRARPARSQARPAVQGPQAARARPRTARRARRRQAARAARRGDPRGETTLAWNAKEAVRSLYEHTDPDVALEWVDQLSEDLRDRDCPPEIRQLGRTMRRWRTQIAAWHRARSPTAPPRP
jgi:transposase